MATALDVDPFTPAERGLVEPDPTRTAMREAGPVVRLDAPAGGPVWIVTDESLAREVLADPRVVKDPAWAPEHWNPWSAGLEQTAAQQPSLTTLDGPPHAELRRAHVPLFSAKRLQAHAGRIEETARELLTAAAAGGPVDLVADLTTRYPLTVVLDLLGVSRDHLEEAVAACRLMVAGDPARQGEAIGRLAALAGTAVDEGREGLAVELRGRLGDEGSDADVRYHLFGLVFAGQLTTDASLGFVLAAALQDRVTDADALVADALRQHPPAPFSLWRFTAAEVELGGDVLPPRSPVLVDIQGTTTHPHRGDGPDLVFGAAAHYCVGAQLAQLELRTIVEVLRADFPDARLMVPPDSLRQRGFGGIQGSRVVELPVLLR